MHDNPKKELFLHLFCRRENETRNPSVLCKKEGLEGQVLPGPGGRTGLPLEAGLESRGADFSVDGAGKVLPASSGGNKLLSLGSRSNPTDACGAFLSGARASKKGITIFY